MRIIEARNPHHALPLALDLLNREGHVRESRAGPVLTVDGPVTTVYTHPWECVVFHPRRDANPFFHLMEALWMLAGRHDAEFLSRFNSRVGRFAEDDGTFHGAYGHRWRRAFGKDQLLEIARALKEKPDCRRQVLQMWCAVTDLAEDKRDLPCNVCVHFQVNSVGRLDMTVFCRSNDVMWGCYGSDCVTFGILQQVIANSVGIPPGRYWQVSDNFHGYLDTAGPLIEARLPADGGPYPDGSVNPLRPIDWISNLPTFLTGCGAFCDAPERGDTGQWFLDRVATPLARAYSAFKGSRGAADRYDRSIALLAGAIECDWTLAARQWLERKCNRA